MTDIIKKSQQTALKFLEPKTLDATYPVLIKESMKLLKAQYGSLFLEKKGKLERVFASSPLLNKTIIQENGNTYSAFQLKKISILNTDDVKHIHPIIKELNIKSTAYIPLIYKNTTVGIISLDTTKQFYLSKKQSQQLQWLGSIATLCLTKLQEYKDIKNSLENRDLFISMASHELKTPLTTINMYTQLLSKKFEKNRSPETTWMETLSSEITRLTMLVNDLLKVESIETGYLHYRWKPCRIQEIVNRAINDFKLTYPHKIVIEDFLREDEDIIWGDFDKLLQVILNLLSNSAKFSPSDSEIMITLKKQYHSIKVDIRDRGKGISRKDLPNIFNKYYRGNSKTSHSGMGLGLYLVKNIIENHNGYIAITSQWEKGTVAHITLPQYSSWQKQNHRDN